MIRKISLVALSVLLLSLPALAAEEAKAPEPKHLTVNVKNLDGGGDTTLKPFLKKDFLLVVFFQSACIGCQTELKELKAAYPSEQAKFDVIGIGVDVRPEPLKGFVAEMGYPKTVLWDPEFRLGPRLRVFSTPAMTLLNKQGEIVEVFSGYTPDTINSLKAKLK